MEPISPLEADALVQAKDFFNSRGTRLTDGDIGSIERLVGFNPTWAAMGYLKQYNNGNQFMQAMQTKLRGGAPFSVAMIRAILNVLHDEVRGIEKKADPRSTKPYQCFDCDELCIGIDALNEHRANACPKRWVKCEHCDDRIRANQEHNCQTGKDAITGDMSDLDISSLVGNRAYFALPNPRAHEPEQDSFLYFVLWRRTSKGKRDRQYVWSKYRTRAEVVPAGTLEVKWQRGDTKKLVGEQRPGELYRGEFVDELRTIAQNPEVWARLYGLQLHKCGRCGKSLTDDISKALGFGPDCIEIMQEHGWGWRDPKDPEPDPDDSSAVSTGGGFV